jgi:hypothetical protein
MLRVHHSCFAQVAIHTALAIPKGDDPTRFPSRPMYARATAGFHSLPGFSNVAILGIDGRGESQEWYAQVRNFITCNLPAPGDQERKELAIALLCSRERSGPADQEQGAAVGDNAGRLQCYRSAEHPAASTYRPQVRH